MLGLELNPADTRSAASHDTLWGKSGWQALVLHDLRSPLALISGQAQLLRRRLARTEADPTDDLRDVQLRLDRIVRAVTQMAGMLDELQDLARSAADAPPPPRYAQADLVELAQRVAADSVEHSERLVAVIAAEPRLLGHWDAGRLERALGNLVSNAIKYSPDGGEVEVLIWREPGPTGDRAAISVRDNGVGIPSVDLPHIFERFYRGTNVAAQFDGAGLGLAGVLQVVEQHGGSVTAESEEGRGSSFTVRLPLD